MSMWGSIESALVMLVWCAIRIKPDAIRLASQSTNDLFKESKSALDEMLNVV